MFQVAGHGGNGGERVTGGIPARTVPAAAASNTRGTHEAAIPAGRHDIVGGWLGAAAVAVGLRVGSHARTQGGCSAAPATAHMLYLHCM